MSVRFHINKDKFSDEEQFVAENAAQIVFVTERYKRSYRYENSCFVLRSKWMVDRSSRVIAVFNGTTVGAKHTIDYAKSRDKDIRFIVCEKPKLAFFMICMRSAGFPDVSGSQRVIMKKEKTKERLYAVLPDHLPTDDDQRRI